MKYSLPIILFITSFLFLFSLQWHFRSKTTDGVHFQQWTSDQMMQALPAAALQANPLHALWYLHKQPPGLDLIRAVVIQFFPTLHDKELVNKTDQGLYLVWNLIYSAIGLFIFYWLKETNILLGLIGWFFWILHPSAIYYSILLDSTNLSSLCTIWLFYELWRDNEAGCVVRPRPNIPEVALIDTFQYELAHFFPAVE